MWYFYPKKKYKLFHFFLSPQEIHQQEENSDSTESDSLSERGLDSEEPEEDFPVYFNDDLNFKFYFKIN
jgi:hypothetical protein